MNNARIEGSPIQQIDSVIGLRDKYVRPVKEETFYDSRLRQRLSKLEPNQAVLISKYSVENSAHATLTTIDQLELSREESRTAVRFGQLAIDRAQAHPINEIVAVKYTNDGLASREFSAFNAFADKGLNTYEPLGFVNNGAQRNNTGLLTRYRHNTYSLDNILWDEERFNTQMDRTAALSRAAVWFATMHMAGFAHGDAQPKNVAFDSSDRPLYVDLETASQYQADMAKHRRAAIDDVADFYQYQISAIDPKEVKDYFIEPYLEQHNAEDVIPVMSGRDMVEASSRPLNSIVHFGPTK